MRSLFRIDRASATSSEGVFVQLPRLEDLLDKEEYNEAFQEEQAGAIGSQEKAEKKSEEDTAYREKLEDMEELNRQIEEKRLEAQRLVEEAHAECERIKEQARQDGYAKAHEEAAKKAERQIEEQRQSFKRLCDSINTELGKYRQEVEEGMLEVALAAAEKIVYVELDRNDEVFLQIVRETSTFLHRDIKKVIHVSEKDFEHYFKDADAEINLELDGVNAAVIADASLKPGDCLLLSGYGTIDMSVKSQIKQMKQKLEEV